MDMTGFAENDRRAGIPSAIHYDASVTEMFFPLHILSFLQYQ